MATAAVGEALRAVIEPRELTRESSIQLWAQKRQQGWQPCEPQWLPPPAPAER